MSRQAIDNSIQRVLREGRVVGLANHPLLVSRDGREIPIADSGAPIRGAGGTLHGAVMVFRDVTEQANLERLLVRKKETAEAADQAESEVGERSTFRVWAPSRGPLSRSMEMTL